jgi:hypothetical protein
MRRQLLLVNVALAALAVVSVGYIVRELRTPVLERARRPAPAAPPAAAPPASLSSETPSGGYAVVASRNLFSPTRSEAPATPVGAAAPQVPKPNLYGIILRDGAPVAYLEDPTTKRVAGYRLGDAVAGGTVKQIGADHVVLNRPEGDVNVRLRDPSKPKPAAPVPAAGTPGAPPQPGAIPPRTGVPTPPSAQATPGVPVQPGMPVPTPGAQQPPRGPQPPQILPRRPLPPNLLRRLPPPPASDAPAQQ